MQVTINLDANLIEKLEKFREKEITRFDSLIVKFEGVDSEDHAERTKFLTGYAENYRKLPMDMLLLRYLV